jgi:hypothetical protein
VAGETDVTDAVLNGTISHSGHTPS